MRKGAAPAFRLAVRLRPNDRRRPHPAVFSHKDASCPVPAVRPGSHRSSTMRNSQTARFRSAAAPDGSGSVAASTYAKRITTAGRHAASPTSRTSNQIPAGHQARKDRPQRPASESNDRQSRRSPPRGCQRRRGVSPVSLSPWTVPSKLQCIDRQLSSWCPDGRKPAAGLRRSLADLLPPRMTTLRTAQVT